MPNEVQRHYDALLSTHYSWMFGSDFQKNVVEQLDILLKLGIKSGIGGAAIDLGSGPGFQTGALLKLGFESILSVDTSDALLEELRQNISDTRVKVIQEDICNIGSLCAPETADVVVCMGDTITHLQRSEDVRLLIQCISAVLKRDGLMVFTFRDLSSPLYGIDRFIPIRADSERIMTCVLDYGVEVVTVTDLVHLKSIAGWKLHKSSYDKLILPAPRLANWINESGCNVLKSVEIGRMHGILAVKL